MRTTFLLPLVRMLEAFYRAIKAVNQSLLNDPWFLTCFTGYDTVVAAHCTFSVAYLHNLWLSELWIHFVTALLHCQSPWMGWMQAVCIIVDACICKSRKKKMPERREGKQMQNNSSTGVVFQLPMYSCRDVFATACTSHKFGSTGYTYRQLMCFRLDTVKGHLPGKYLWQAGYRAFHSRVTRSIRVEIPQKACVKADSVYQDSRSKATNNPTPAMDTSTSKGKHTF